MIDPTVLVAIAGLATTAAGYLAGRNRALARTLRTATETYETLIEQLREEINRLRAEVTELRALMRRTPRTPRKVNLTVGL